MNTDLVRVIFRIFRDHGEVIALFPDLPGTNDGFTCESYQHVGQHGAADPDHIVSVTRPATPAEYAPLMRELQGAPFHYLFILRARLPSDSYRKRCAQLEIES